MKTLKLAALLIITISYNLHSQNITYGQNPKAGKFVQSSDAKIYYEVYGEGQPIVLLHSGFGYIDSFEKYIPILSKDYRVIAIASRGYGKSEMGNKDFSYNLLAEDIKTVIETESKEKAIIMGYSDGAMIAYLIAHNNPELVNKVVTMGGPLGTIGYDEKGLEWLNNYDIQQLDHYASNLKAMMPQPERWNEFSNKLEAMWNTSAILTFEELNNIKCPVLLMFGDSDLFCTPEHAIQIYNNLTNGQLAIFPRSGHNYISYRNTQILEQYILPYIKEE